MKKAQQAAFVKNSQEAKPTKFLTGIDHRRNQSDTSAGISEKTGKQSFYKDYETDLVFRKRGNETSKETIKSSARIVQNPRAIQLSDQELLNYEEIKQKYISKKKKGKSKSTLVAENQSQKPMAAETNFGNALHGNSSKKSSEASTKLAGTGSMSFSKLALLKSNATDYLNGFIQFSKKSRKPHDLFHTEEAQEKPEAYQTYETLESQARTFDDDARLNFQKFNLLKLNYNTTATNTVP